MSSYIVLRFETSGDKRAYGPIEALSPAGAIRVLCGGYTQYIAPKHGRFCAIPLDVWQAGVYDWTKARGEEKVI